VLTEWNRITLISFINSLQQQASFAWVPYVTSAFSAHGLTGITVLVSTLVSGVSKLPLARFIDVVGRPQGFAICLLCVLVGKYSPSEVHSLDYEVVRAVIDTDYGQLLR